MRTFSMWMSWIGCLGSVLLALLVWLQAGFVRLHVVGAFSELRAHGIIDEGRLNGVYAESLRQDPSFVPVPLLLGDVLDRLVWISWAGCGVLLLASVASLLVLWREDASAARTSGLE